jgi:TolA-binding protein
LLYIPARDQAIMANNQIKAIEEQSQIDLEDAAHRIVKLEETIESLSTLETQNVELQKELDSANLHIVILSARADVATAQLILVKGEDVSKARIALSRTSDTLDTLGDMLEHNQRKIVSDLQERLELVLDELEDNPYAAESDLDVLARGLLELESAFFTQP